MRFQPVEGGKGVGGARGQLFASQISEIPGAGGGQKHHPDIGR